MPAGTGFEVFRDAWGVPHVRAADELALAEGQGYVTARDRTWQLLVGRWRADGRLAERIGPAGVAWDVLAHRARIADTAQRAYDALADDDRAWVDAYVAGVRAGMGSVGDLDEVAEVAALATLGDPLPVDEPWPAWMPLAVFVVEHVLFSGFPHLLWREHVARTLAAAHPGRRVEEVVDLFSADSGPSSGSNAWALAGSRTASGLPLLAGDPHRLLELPGVYQQVRLACPAYDVVGLAFPGVPGVSHFGHAGDAAWGVTNAMAHHAEVFTERLRRTSGLEALGPDGWEPAASGSATVRVRGGDDVPVEWVETARGPVVTDLVRDGDELVAHSLRTAFRTDRDVGVGAMRALLRARSADDVAAAFARWVDPVDRVLTADRTGRVLSLTAGRVPRRTPTERVRPLDAWSTGPAPARTLPAPVVVEDVAVDANERPVREGTDLGHRYAPSHRARRIRELLDAGAGTAADLQHEIHGDTVLDHTRYDLVALLDGGPPTASADARAAAGRLRGWDRRMDAGSTDAGLFAAWRGALVRRVAEHPALAPLRVPHGLGDVYAPWFSLRARVGDGLPAIARARWLLDARVEAWAALEEVASGPPPGAWGDTHRVLPLHVLLDVDGAEPPRVEPVPLPGDTDCVCATASTPGVTDRCVRGPVARWVWDLADRDASRWSVPFGASGDAGSPHLADQHTLWARAETARVVTDWSALRREEA